MNGASGKPKGSEAFLQNTKTKAAGKEIKNANKSVTVSPSEQKSVARARLYFRVVTVYIDIHVV